MENQAYALVKALKYFRFYVIHSHVIAYIPNVVKYILSQPDLECRRGRQIVYIIEYDVEIKPTKLIKDQGLEKLTVDSNLSVLDINFIVSLSDDNDLEPSQYVSEKFISFPWYADIVYVLQHLQTPLEMKKKARFLKLKTIKFYIFNQFM